MKTIVTLFSLLVSTALFSQVDPVTDQYVGNGNILLSPGAENGKKGWVNSAGTFTVESAGAIKGSRVFKVALSSQTMNFYQDSTLYASQYADEIQGLIKVMIKSDVALKLCSRNAGVTNTNNCLPVYASNKWQLYKLPFILKGTSNGLAIISDSNVSGTVYIDDAFVGAVDVEAIQTFDTTCDTVACQTEFSVNVNSDGTIDTNGENVDFINGNCTISDTSLYTCNFNSGIFTVTPNCVATVFSSSTNAAIATIWSQTTSSLRVRTTRTTEQYILRAFKAICQRSGADYEAALQAQKDYEKSKIVSYSTPSQEIAVLASRTTTQSIASSSNYRKVTLNEVDYDTLNSFDLANSRVIIPEDGYYIVRGHANFSTSASGDRGVSIFLNEVQTTINAGTTQLLAGTGNTVIETSPTMKLVKGDIIELYVRQTSGAALSLTTSSLRINKLPSNIIIGQFNGLEKCTDSYECTDTFSARVSTTGVVSDENIDWINGNASLTDVSSYAITFKSGIFTQDPNCQITTASNTTNGRINAISPTLLNVRTQNTSTGANQAALFFVTCQKQGVDYIGKTAKAVASDQNLRTPGLTNVKVCGIQGTTGSSTIAQDKGSCVQSASSGGTGVQNITFASGYFSNAPICSCIVIGGTAIKGCSVGSVSSGSLIVRTTGTAALENQSYSMVCMGE
jgi:hypothetical protein